MTRLSGPERRAQILAAAREEFLQVGPDGARIGDIADRAGINVALLYRHFESKEQLFDAAIVEPLNERLGGLVAEVTREAATADGPDEVVQIFYRSLLTIFVETIELLGVVLFTERDAGQKFYAKSVAPFVDSLTEVVRHGADEWPQVYAPEITVPICIGMCWGTAIDASFREIDLNIDETARVMAGITRHGILPN